MLPSPYDDVNTVSFNDASFPVAGMGCTASSSATITGSYKITTSGGGNLHDGS
jgi:hypothetical protein